MKIFPSKTKRNVTALELSDSFEQTHKKAIKEAWVAGRIVGILDDGFVLQDESKRIDIEMDGSVNVGDIVEVKIRGDYRVGKDGREYVVFKSENFNVLKECECEFFIKKEDPNYKKIVIDLAMKAKMDVRMNVISGIREFFSGEGFNEVDTPGMVKYPGMEPYLDPFKTEFKSVKGEKDDRYLITSPEYAMKKLLVSGYEKIFQICKSFRNKETDGNLHNPEFTLLEWYRSYTDYFKIMEDTEMLITHLSKKLFHSEKIEYQKNVIDVSLPWRREKVKDLFKKYANIDYSVFEDEQKFRSAVDQKGYSVDKSTSYDDLFFMVFMNEIEPKLGFDKPVIVYEYPSSMAALAKKCEGDEKYAQRFELYIAGMELCNAFTELNDPTEQRKRFEEERLQRKKMRKDDYPVDQSFIRALEFGMPPSGGNALGVDRLAMLFADVSDIRDLLYFPHRDL